MEYKEEFMELDDTYLPQMAELYRSAFRGAPWNDDWSDEAQLHEYMKEITHSCNPLNFGLFSEGRLIALSVGMIRHWWEGTNYNIEELCVAPDMQAQGVGTHFMGMIEAEVRRRGLKGIFLQTDSDKPAFGFYRKNGFNVLDSHVSLYKKV